MQFRLDYSQKQEMQISNDAFFYLLEEEEPLDEESMIREVQRELMERKQKVSQVVASENKKIYAENKKRLDPGHPC